MAFAAKDGSKHTNIDSMKRADAKQTAQAPVAQPEAAPSIEQDPEAMQCVQILQQKGYTPDDIERAMGGSEGQEISSSPEGY